MDLCWTDVSVVSTSASTAADQLYDVFHELESGSSDCSDVAAMVGCGRKGRKRGCKNRTQKTDKIKKNETKKANERQRVKNISKQYCKLRNMLGDPHPEKKLRKQQILNAAIQYINHLMNILDEPPIGDAQSPAMSNTSEDFESDLGIQGNLKCCETFEESESEISSPSDTPVLVTSSASTSCSLDFTALNNEQTTMTLLSLNHLSPHLPSIDHMYLPFNSPVSSIELHHQYNDLFTEESFYPLSMLMSSPGSPPPPLHHINC